MGKSTAKPSADPASLKELAVSEGLPVVLSDHWVTRRQRVHTLIFPDARAEISGYNLVEVLDSAALEPGSTAILANVDLAGTLFACYIQLHPFHTEDPNDGQT